MSPLILDWILAVGGYLICLATEVFLIIIQASDFHPYKIIGDDAPDFAIASFISGILSLILAANVIYFLFTVLGSRSMDESQAKELKCLFRTYEMVKCEESTEIYEVTDNKVVLEEEKVKNMH